MSNNQHSKESVLSAINKAFYSVKLGEGIGLWQAQAIDDYESEDKQLKARASDRKSNWHLFTKDELYRCVSSLSFFDAEGMRFHLPAFMTAELQEEDGSVVFSLTHLDDYTRNMFTCLNKAQRKSVRLFLEYCLSREEYDFEHDDVKRAINEYWS